MIALLLALLIQREPLPSYADARNCAALAIAHHRALADNDPVSRKAFDTSLYWSLTVGERARKDVMNHAQFERDLFDSTEAAARRLAARDPAATAELARCITRVPH